MERRRRGRWRGTGRTSMASFMCIFSICSLYSSASRLDLGRTPTSLSSVQGAVAMEGRMRGRRWMAAATVAVEDVGRAGSSPPRCACKCEKCTPCVPVHVSVPPGMAVVMEYYPEAWRCKCGSKLYVP